eukprot:11342749-Alexandrium_andersonii.AAC.1
MSGRKSSAPPRVLLAVMTAPAGRSNCISVPNCLTAALLPCLLEVAGWLRRRAGRSVAGG